MSKEAKPKKSKEQLKEEQRQRGLAHKNNLVDISTRPKEEQLAIRQKGHKAMMEIKRKRRNIEEILDIIGALEVTDIATEYANPVLIEKLKATGEDISVYDLINLVQTEKAMQGSTRSAEYVRDSMGERPKDNVQIDVDIITDSDRELIESIQNRLESLEAIDSNTSDI